MNSGPHINASTSIKLDVYLKLDMIDPAFICIQGPVFNREIRYFSDRRHQVTETARALKLTTPLLTNHHELTRHKILLRLNLSTSTGTCCTGVPSPSVPSCTSETGRLS